MNSRGSNEPLDLVPKDKLYLIFLTFFFFFFGFDSCMNTLTLNFLLSPTEISLTMILNFFSISDKVI